MKISYFDDTDTLYIEFRDSDIAGSKDLDESTILDVDDKVIIASQRTDVSHLLFRVSLYNKAIQLTQEQG